MTVSAPKYNNWFSFGNVITIAFGVVTATGMFSIMDARSQSNAKYITEIRLKLVAVEKSINELEKEQVRADERFGSILGLLERIDTRLERIEGNN